MSFLVNPFRYAVAGCTDADAVAFLAAAGITDSTISLAICTLVTSMKANGTWAKMQAIYPMVGGTATTHKFNLKNPADSNAAFRLVFTANGALPNGTNSIADTFYIPQTSATQNSHHLSYYSRTNSNLTEVEIGAVNSSQGSLVEARTSNVSYFRINSAATYASAADTNSAAYYISNRTASNVINGWRNSTKIATAATPSTTLTSLRYFIGALNDNAITRYYSTKQCAFASIGSGLTDAEAAALYTAVQGFQTTLSRQV
jgi:hypothetical protein